MINTQTNRSFIEEQQYSTFILENLYDSLLPAQFWRDVSDFSAGEVLNIKTIGETVIQEISEDTPIVYNPIESGNIQLQITDYIGNGWYVTDKMRQDSSQLDALIAAYGADQVRKIQEYFETRAFATLNAGQTNANANLVNGLPHRIAATGTGNKITLDHFYRMKLAFDKAEVPYAGRVVVVDPIVAHTLQGLFQGTYNVDANPEFQDILEGGFSRDHQFVMNIAGWNVITSNRLPKGTFSDGTTSVTDGVANIFMSIVDDQTKPLMAAWRQMPSVESGRNKDFARDEFVQRARFGMGVQRKDTYGIVITGASL